MKTTEQTPGESPVVASCDHGGFRLLVLPRGAVGNAPPIAPMGNARHGLAATPFGMAFFGGTSPGLCRLAFLDSPEAGEKETGLLARDWPGLEWLRDDDWAATMSGKIFNPAGNPRIDEPFPLCVRGTFFQASVWLALLRIPRGQTTTYAEIARRIGKPKASRAVGNAVANNPVAFAIPCHRVVPANGTTGNYRWGKVRKATLLLQEQA